MVKAAPKPGSWCEIFRQSGIGFYVADFYAPSFKLAIELDGSHHTNDPDVVLYDEARTEQFENLGITILRFKNSEVRYQLDMVVERIREKVQELSPR